MELRSLKRLSLLLISMPLLMALVPRHAGTPKPPKALKEALFRECKNLRGLSLASDVADLEWIRTRKLRRLTAPGITSLEGLPRSLHELDINGATGVEELQYIPKNLKYLDIQDSGIRDLKYIPTRLQVLKLSDLSIKRADVLPPNLQALYLDSAQIHDFADLPRDLKELHISAPAMHFEKLENLPPSLRVLTLRATKGESLQGIPRSVQELKLIGNDTLRFETEDLPERLTELTIDQPLGPKDLSKLKYLTWLSDLRSVPATSLPTSLSSFTFEASDFNRLPKLPSGLLALGLVHARFDPMKELPPGLEKLSLIGYQEVDLGALAPTLKVFELKYPRQMTKLPELSPALEELYIIDTKIVELTGQKVESLTVLVACKNSQIRMGEIGARFPNLERLDACESSGLSELGPLPGKLKRLNISHTKIRQLPDFHNVPDLEELNISHAPIELESLHVLPRGLKILVLSKEQVQSWEGFPPSLEVLRVED